MKQVLYVILVGEVHSLRPLASVRKWVHCPAEALNDDVDYLINRAGHRRDHPRCNLTELIAVSGTSHRENATVSVIAKAVLRQNGLDSRPTIFPILDLCWVYRLCVHVLFKHIA